MSCLTIQRCSVLLGSVTQGIGRLPAIGKHTLVLEVQGMLKKVGIAVFGLVIAVGLASPPKADAEVGIGLQIGAPEAGYTSGYHEGYYYENGYRYQRDARGYRHYDHAFGGQPTGNMPAPIATETIMTSITQTAIIATGNSNEVHFDNHSQGPASLVRLSPRLTETVETQSAIRGNSHPYAVQRQLDICARHSIDHWSQATQLRENMAIIVVCRNPRLWRSYRL